MTATLAEVRGLVVLVAVVLAFGLAGCSDGAGSARPAGDDFEQKGAKESATVTDPSQALYGSGGAPTPTSRFAYEDGFFAIPRYDDRQLSDEQKAADPARDPRWPAFVRCMQTAGFGLAIGNPDQTTQAEIDALVREVNRSGPAYEWSPRGPVYRPSPGADAFLRCERHLYFEAAAPSTTR